MYQSNVTSYGSTALVLWLKQDWFLGTAVSEGAIHQSLMMEIDVHGTLVKGQFIRRNPSSYRKFSVNINLSIGNPIWTAFGFNVDPVGEKFSWIMATIIRRYNTENQLSDQIIIFTSSCILTFSKIAMLTTNLIIQSEKNAGIAQILKNFLYYTFQ